MPYMVGAVPDGKSGDGASVQPEPPPARSRGWRCTAAAGGGAGGGGPLSSQARRPFLSLVVRPELGFKSLTAEV